MYIDVPTSTNLVRDDKKIITVVASKATVTFTDDTLVFSTVAGVSRIASAGLGTAFDDDDQIIVRNSIKAAAPAVNNDGVYTIIDASNADYITVVEPVIAATSDGDGQVDEIDTFILHPTKRIEQVCVCIIVGANPVSLSVSFVPGDFWAASIKKNIPETQGDLLLANNTYFIQVESAKYLQTKSEDLAISGDSDDDVDKKGTLLMRLFGAASAALSADVDVALIQLY